MGVAKLLMLALIHFLTLLKTKISSRECKTDMSNLQPLVDAHFTLERLSDPVDECLGLVGLRHRLTGDFEVVHLS